MIVSSLPALAARMGCSVFLLIYFVLQSYLQFFKRSEGETPFHVVRQRRLFGLYGGLVVMLTALSGLVPTDIEAILLGIMIPGAGFLQWAGEGQFVFALALFIAGLCFFAAALILWFATGNVMAPAITWLALVALSAKPDLVALDKGLTAWGWPLVIAPSIVIGLSIVISRPVRPLEASIISVAPTEKHEGAVTAEFSLDELQRLRILLDRALQPAERFDGFEWRDQFQTAAVRYQVNFVAYALALARQRCAPAADAYFLDAQQKLLAKIGDRRMWNYWRLENAWGNFRFSADPVPDQNIMYAGFTALQMAVGGTERELALHRKGCEWRRYDLGEIARRLSHQYEASPYGLLACEPNWIYPLCNLITIAGLKAADARLGTDHWPRLKDAFLRNLRREGTKPDGSFIAFRSGLTGLAPPTPGGIVMQAFPCLFLNSLAPDLAQEHWRRVRLKLDTADWRRLFWPVDIGNYGFSRATSYAATAAAAAELGDHEVAQQCLARLEAECPSRWEQGCIHRLRASLWAHALETVARSNPGDGLSALVGSPGKKDGPRLVSAPYPEVLIAQAVAHGDRLHLVLYPGAGEGRSIIGLGGLRPGQGYSTGHDGLPFVEADGAGCAELGITLSGRTRLTIEPVT